jgi:hypothetical protein
VILNKKETGVAGDPAPKNQTPYLFLYNRSSDEKIYYIKNAPYLWGLNLLPTLTVKSNQFRKSFYHVVSEKRGYVYNKFVALFYLPFPKIFSIILIKLFTSNYESL